MNYQDQLSRTIFLPSVPTRIISLVPSHTELLYDLGLDDQIVGITRFCIFPERARKDKRIIGGTKKLKIDRIRDLKPDFIFADKEENTKEEIEILAQEFPVWISTIRVYEDALEMIRRIGQIMNRQALSEKMILQIELNFSNIKPVRAPKVAYFIWKDPLMVAANDTFIHEMILKAGCQNAFANKSRYPVISELDIQNSVPDIIMLSSEPYPFQQKHLDYFQKIVPSAKVILVDGTYFSWFGSRMQYAGLYFIELMLNN